MNLLKRLGYSEDEKLLMIHADDVGLSHSQNKATVLALEGGLVNSYSIMVPCYAFEEIAEFANHNPQYEYGLHLTLNCEWHHKRFGPVSEISTVSGLVDEEGCFYKKRNLLVENATAIEVKIELEAQIEKALDVGLTPSHLDSHMYSVGASPDFFRVYKDLEKKYGIPVFLNHQFFDMVGFDSAGFIHDNDLFIDQAYIGQWDWFEKGRLKDYYRNVISNLKSGINKIVMHPAFDDEEMKQITKDHSSFGSVWRQQEYEFFTSEECENLLKENNIKLFTWRDIQQAKRN